MRNFNISGSSITELSVLPQQLPETGFVWIACTRAEFETSLAEIQACLQNLCGLQLVDLHVADLANPHLPSHFDFTLQYDVLVFRRLAATSAGAAGPASTTITTSTTSTASVGSASNRAAAATPGTPSLAAPATMATTAITATTASSAPHAPSRRGPPVLKRIDTTPVGFAVFDRVVLSVHPQDGAVRDAYANRLLNSGPTDNRSSGSRLPTCPADLMLRVVNLIVDGFLELRRELTHQLDHWEGELISPHTRFNNWRALLEARRSLHDLDEVCEDQRSAIQDWNEALKTWPEAETPAAARERDLLQVRSRDVLEHIERVVHHVRRLEQSAETAVQIHFSVQGSRTNDIMRTLTVLTAIFLPLNLITGFFGMNFEFMPLVHQKGAFWWIFGTMVVIALSTSIFFWRKRYLARSMGSGR